MGAVHSTPSLPPTPSPKHFFDKFKLPSYFLTTAFRLYRQPSSPQGHSHHKKPDIVRKHRGNYRKYTVA